MRLKPVGWGREGGREGGWEVRRVSDWIKAINHSKKEAWKRGGGREGGRAAYLWDRDEGVIRVPRCAWAGLGGAVCKTEGRRQGGKSGESSSKRPWARFFVSSV